MIARRLPKDARIADNFTALGKYIAAAREEGEKLDRFWIAGCDAGEELGDLDAALAEIEAVRKHKLETKNKTYHLMVSFRPGDEEKLSTEALKHIEEEFAAALGLQDHQRVAGTHINTDNFHMHVAYNLVNPRALKMAYPRHDFKALANTARAMEQKYGLAIDRGMTDGIERKREGLSPEAQDYERHTWQRSFQRYLLENREGILKGMHEARDWQAVHQGLANYGVALRKRGNGLVFVEAEQGRQAMKASVFDRSCSKPALEKRLGRFEPMKKEKTAGLVQAAGRHRYKPRPLLRGHPATAQLWRRYMTMRRPVLKRPGVMSRAARNWKLFLMAEAYYDPMAMVLILAHKEMLGLLLGKGQAPSKQVPKMLEGPLARWRPLVPAQSAEARVPVVVWPASNEQMKDGSENAIAPQRNSQGMIVGLLIQSTNGHFIAMPEAATGKRARGWRPYLGLDTH